jgi:hypothetical protein
VYHGNRRLEVKDVISMDIEIKRRSRIKRFFQKLHSKSEDILFSIISKLPEKLVPPPLMEWLGRYIDRRIQQTKQQIAKSRWRQDSLEKALSDISLK